MKFATQSGHTIEVSRARRIGRGGEGEVLTIASDPHLVAKLYHQPTAEQRLKLEWMVANQPPQSRGRLFMAWPTDILFSSGPRPRFAGYVMPRVTAAHPLFVSYNPASRRANHLDIGYQFLVRTARNLSAAVASAHALRAVLADLNESNVLVCGDARVILIDCDSWQLYDTRVRKTYRSPVAKGEFLPPELQGKNLASLDRFPWHDGFALAVLLFKLLCEGAHPADGVYCGPGAPPSVEERIAQGIFPCFGRAAGWTPKPHGLPFSALHPRLQRLFADCFLAGHARPRLRPDAARWRDALASAEKDFRACQHNPNHVHWGSRCPWCELTQSLRGRDPFPNRHPAKTSRVKRVAAAKPPAPAKAVKPRNLVRRNPPVPMAPVMLPPLKRVLAQAGLCLPPRNPATWFDPNPVAPPPANGASHFKALWTDVGAYYRHGLRRCRQNGIAGPLILLATTLAVAGAALMSTLLWLLFGAARIAALLKHLFTCNPQPNGAP